MSNKIERDTSAEPKQWFSGGLLLAFLTGGVYWITFQYEAAYLKAYGFPLHLVEVSLESILVVLLLLSAILWVLFPFANLLAIFWPQHPALQEKLARVALLLGLIVWNLIVYGFRREDLFYYITTICILTLFEIIWPAVVFSDKKSLKDRFIADEIAEAETRRKAIFGRIFRALGPAGYILVLLVLLGGWLAHSAGDARAKTERHYLVYVSDPTLAIVRLYQQRALCIRVDPEKRLLTSIVVRPTVDANEELRKEDVGPIKYKH